MNTFRITLCALLVAVMSMVPGCNAVDDAAGFNNVNVGDSLKQPNGSLTRKELAQKLRRLAMSYLGEIPEACEQIAGSDVPLDQRLMALRIRVNSTDSVISMAADPDPQVSLLNMVTVLTLQRMLAEDRAADFFGENGKLYVDASKRMEDEAWKLAAQVMDEKERAQLRELITVYRKDHPEELYVWWVRFSEFSAYKEQFSIASVGQGVVDIFVPAGAAVAGLESTTDVAERATWLAARQALIIQWRVELTYLQALSAPETARVLDDIERVAATVEALPGQIEKERLAIFKAVEDQQGSLSKLLTQSKEIVAEVNDSTKEANKIVAGVDEVLKTAGVTVEGIQQTITQADKSIADAKAILPGTETALAQLEVTSDSLNRTLKTLDIFMRQFESDDEASALEGAEPEAEGRPFDITEYTVAVAEAGKTIEGLNTLVTNIDQAAEPTRLDATLEQLMSRLRGLIWLAGLVLAGVGLVLVLAVKLIPRRGGAKPVVS